MATLVSPTSPARTRDAVLLRGVSIVLPSFNEEANIAESIRNATAAAAMSSEDYEIIVVDDGSTDGTARVVSQSIESDPHLRLIVHTRNRGYGDAVRSGIDAAQMDWVLLSDADLQFDLRELADFVPVTSSADVLWGQRILREDRLSRRAFSAAWNRLMRALFRLPVRDVDCAFKLIRRDLLQRFRLQTSGAMISTELLVRCRAEGARVVEVGVHHHPRVAGEESGAKARVVLRAFRELATMYPTLRRLSYAPALRPIEAHGG
jgi:glycosyltransferase involved in cell wall biosynthesis